MSEKNGQFVILNVKLMKNRPEEKRLYWQTPAEVDLGNPVSLFIKLPVSYSPDLHKTGFTDVLASVNRLYIVWGG